ncbi:MAG: CBS domain-containing protein [Saprospiraceae bacterium]|nr:CBS domain-containing protein [Saprospiraceae bacterium]
MYASEIVSIDIPALGVRSTGEDALNIMEEYMVRHLPIIENGEVVGLVSEEMILDNDPAAWVSTYQGSDRPAIVHNEDHILEVLGMVAKTNNSCIPVTDNKNKYLGVITLQTLILKFASEFSLDEPGAILVLEVNKVDYSLTEISRIIESEKGVILACFVSKQHPDTNQCLITLKVNVQDIQFIKATLERFNYSIVATFTDAELIDTLAERYDALMHYLNM